ncbi:hypothetical protein M422DRAFT_70791 [Sphaerobolus stellatus SS14]|uniref:Uncharacterized protein n=1 Tax=Sphaerobolus stellatus (strain SS14) TaxID=990650 RepID=A0A0C9TP48_SPHS4|nr:hypothetical protein M422DRAFT_70791 [Sphaerobolus stellatus SS14]
MSNSLHVNPEELNIPGGVGFVDATHIINEAAETIDLGTILNMEQFGLQDAMSAIEIMDPRMDNGMAEPASPFNPNMPLLPEEVCWILDRAFAAEMAWHTGLMLSQTVFTLRYVHHLHGNISQPRFKVDTETWLSTSHIGTEDTQRPPELVNLVLRAGMHGLIKCCDLAWRELYRQNLYEGEDWSGEKSSVSLCEHIQPEAVLDLIDEAVAWLQTAKALSQWQRPLISRLNLRRSMLHTVSYPSYPALIGAKRCLDEIISGPIPPNPREEVCNAFDPKIASRLASFVPTRTVDLPPQQDVWTALMAWIEQWEETASLVGARRLWSVKVLAGVRAYEDDQLRRIAISKAYSMGTFFDEATVLGTHDPPWLIDRFFFETGGVPASLLSELGVAATKRLRKPVKVDGDEKKDGMPSTPSEEVDLLEKGVAKLLVEHFLSYYHNRPRQRRKLVTSLLDWHLAFDHATRLIVPLLPLTSRWRALLRIPLCIRYIRLSVITEVLFSGFELELYAQHEWAMIYWYMGEVLGTMGKVFNQLISSLEYEVRDDNNGDTSLKTIVARRDYYDTLRHFVDAMRDMTYWLCSAKNVTLAREQVDFERRLKWAYESGYSEATILDEDRPDLRKWRVWKDQHSQDHIEHDWIAQASENLARSQEGFVRLRGYSPAECGAEHCPEAYNAFLLGHQRACESNLHYLRAIQGLGSRNSSKWLWSHSKWFPVAMNHET